MKKYLKKYKQKLIAIDSKFGSQILFKRRIKMLKNKYQLAIKGEFVASDKIVLTTIENYSNCAKCKRVIVFIDQKSLVNFVLSVDKRDDDKFEQLVEDYMFEYDNTEDGIVISTSQTDFFNPMKQKHRGLKPKMSAFIGNLTNNDNFILFEINYEKKQMCVTASDISKLELQKPLYICLYNRGFLIREF